MSVQKTEALSLGSGSLLDYSKSLVVFSAPNQIEAWSNSINYLANQVTEYSNIIWRCVAPNLNSQPSATNANWQIIYKGCKDGDTCFVYDGSFSVITQRVNNVWQKYREVSKTIELNDGQLAPTSFLTVIGSSSFFSKFEYTLRRGAGHIRKRAGSMNILNDGNNSLSYDHEFTEIGDDVDAWITPTISSNVLQILYVSGFEGNPLYIEYMLKGWGQ